MEIADQLHKDTKGSDESGYSEKKTDTNIELQAGQWLDLKTRQQKSPPSLAHKPVHTGRATRQILLDYQQQVLEKLTKKINDYRDVLAQNRDVSELLPEIQRLQTTLGAVLKSLKWEQKGELDTSKLPKEVQNLLK